MRFIDEMNKKGHAIPVVFYPMFSKHQWNDTYPNIYQ